MVKDVPDSRLGYTKAPYGLLEGARRLPALISSKSLSDSLYEPRRYTWTPSCSSEPKNQYFLHSNYIKFIIYHVSHPNSNILSRRQCSKVRKRCKGLRKRTYTLSSRSIVSLVSSDQPSPQSSIASFVFSSGASSSSRSPESSQGSSTDTSPYPIHLARRQPRIQVASLLADPFTRTYHLEVIQHPQKTAEFGHSSLSRLPLTPPIIARLTVRDSSGNSVVPEAELPFLIAHLSLFSDDGLTPLDMGSSIGRNRTQPLLYGNLVSSVDQLEDLQGVTVVKISRTDSSGGMGIADHGVVLAEARTRSFEVLPHNQYTAAPRTRLTTSFLRQGARMFSFMS